MYSYGKAEFNGGQPRNYIKLFSIYLKKKALLRVCVACFSFMLCLCNQMDADPNLLVFCLFAYSAVSTFGCQVMLMNT